jgi:hypothetical protein
MHKNVALKHLMQSQGPIAISISRGSIENNQLRQSGGQRGKHCGRFCGCGFLKKPTSEEILKGESPNLRGRQHGISAPETFSDVPGT